MKSGNGKGGQGRGGGVAASGGGVALVGSVSAILHTALLIVLTALVAVFYSRSSTSLSHLGNVECWSITPVPCGGAHAATISDYDDSSSSHNDDAQQHCYPVWGLVGDLWAKRVAGVGDMHNNITNHKQQQQLCSNAHTCLLAGVEPEFERESTGLFSSVSVPVLCLAFEVVACCFSLLYVRSAEDRGCEDHHTESWSGGVNPKYTSQREALKRGAILLGMVYAAFLLFMQNSWHIPSNNLLAVEVILMLTLFYIGLNPSATYAKEAASSCTPTPFVGAALSVPPLAVAVLVADGVDISTELLQPFFSLFIAYVLLIALEYQTRPATTRPDTGAEGEGGRHDDGCNNRDCCEAAGVLLLSSWLALVPFVAQCSLVLAGPQPTADRPWAVAALVMLLIYVLLYHCVVTTHCAVALRMMAGWTPKNSNVRLHDLHTWRISALDAIELVAKTGISLTLMIGALTG